MRKPLLTLLLCLSCAHSSSTENQPPPDPPVPPQPVASPPLDGPPIENASSADAGSHSPLATLGHKLPPLPPNPGEHKFIAEGCAAKPAATDSEAQATRSFTSTDKVDASVFGPGILITHDVAHACCLGAASAVSVSNDKVVVTETLSGNPCRCRCDSTLKTSVGLKPGSYQVELKTVTPGKTWTAWQGQLTVK